MSINLYQLNNLYQRDQVLSSLSWPNRNCENSFGLFLEGKSGNFASHLHKSASWRLAVAMAYSELSSLRVEEIN